MKKKRRQRCQSHPRAAPEPSLQRNYRLLVSQMQGRAKPPVKREHILGQYLRGEIPREQAIERLGIDWVVLAERQFAAMAEDLEWAQVE